MTPEFFLKTLASLDPPGVIATVVEAARRGPARVGASLYCRAGLLLTGTVGGGLNEKQVLEAASDLQKPFEFVDIGEEEEGDSQSTGCSGPIKVLLEKIDRDDSLQKFWQELAIELDTIEPMTLLKVVAGNNPPCYFAGTAQGPALHHYSKSHIAAIVEKQWLSFFTLAETVLEKQTLSDQPIHFLSQPLNRVGRVLIFGAGHIAQELSRLLPRLGFPLIIIDPRPELCNQVNFPEVDLLVDTSYLDYFSTGRIRENDYLIIMSPDHGTDRTILELAALSGAGYIGLLGSRAKLASFEATLQEKGLWDELSGRLHSPIGLDIGSKAPAEVAISIAAELISVRPKIHPHTP
ncbi:MAG: XdhC family protein [Thermodesulfobacteriota bacterium]